MTWVTITGAGTTTATKFHGDAMNKISNMFNGTDVTDTVTINSAVTWTFKGTALRVEDSDASHSYIFSGSDLAADRTITLPLLAGNDTLVTEAHSATLTNKTVALGSNTVSGTFAEFNSAVTDETLAGLGATNNFTATQTFTGDVVFSGDLTYTPETKTLSTDAIASGGETSIIAAAESGTADDFSSLTGGANDQYKFLYADTGDTITLKHQASPSADQFVLLGEADKTLSETVPTVVVRRGTVWYEWGGGGGGAAGGATATHAFTNQSSTTYRGTGSAGTGIDVGTAVGTEASGAGEREIYIRKIDTNNEGVFTVIHKNGSTVEVQIA